MNNIRLSTLFLCSFLSSTVAFSQLSVIPNQTATILANKLAGPGITISSPVLMCAGLANGTFKSVTTPITIDSGIVLTTGKAINTIGVESTLASYNNGSAGDGALTTLAGTATHDACVLEFDFIPNGDTVGFNYQFGSEEYINSTCGQYNDVFAFFISGPGITGTQNMALVPGTTIPVTVNSINNGVPGPPGYPGFCNIANCTSMGPGSPFTSYYTDNTGGTQLTYKGFTTKLRAVHNVTPCSSYHLKMAVADASNFLYDSGVFVEAGSLQTNNYLFSHTADSIGHTINGVAHTIVKGCSPATITVLSTRPSGIPYTVNFSYGGTAVEGVDFSGPASAVVPAGSTATTISIVPLATAAAGPKTIEIYLQSPFSCGGNTDTVILNIIDTPTANIVTHDTAVCMGDSFQILAMGSPGLLYNWTPAASLANPTDMSPIATPTGSTVYTMTATLPLSGCPAIIRSINVVVNTATVSILTPDTSVCNGASVHILANGTPGLAYNWLPATGLNDPAVQNPIATPATTTTYSLIATITGNCPAYATITITIFTPTINILTPDTAICVGTIAGIRVDGDPAFTYHWTPANYLDNADIKNPVASPEHNITYEVTATVPGTSCSVTDQVSISFLPQIFAEANGSKSICINDPMPLYASPTGASYSYQWSGPDGFTSALQNPFVLNAVPENAGIYSVIVTNNTTTCSGTDTAMIIVGNASLTIRNMTADQTIPLGSSIQLYADNAIRYTWTPNDGTLSNPNINNPVATPQTKTTYMLYAYSAEGCLDTASVTIDVINEQNIVIPSAFTPNGDGLNDVFHVVNLGNFKLLEMSIFNRWGQMVCHNSDGTNIGWNGVYNDVQQDMGTYNYLIIIGKPDGTVMPYKGNFVLIR